MVKHKKTTSAVLQCNGRRHTVETTPAGDDARLIDPVVGRSPSLGQSYSLDVRIRRNVGVTCQLQHSDVIGEAQVTVVYPIRVLVTS